MQPVSQDLKKKAFVIKTMPPWMLVREATIPPDCLLPRNLIQAFTGFLTLT